MGHGHGHSHNHSHDEGKSGEEMNMRGLFLHVLGDAVGSVVVILSAGLMYFYNNCNEDNLSEVLRTCRKSVGYQKCLDLPLSKTQYKANVDSIKLPLNAVDFFRHFSMKLIHVSYWLTAHLDRYLIGRARASI